MTIDINNYIDAALKGIEDQIEEIHTHLPKFLEAYYGVHGDRITFSKALDKLEQLLRTASDSVEIFQNYNGQYDRVSRHCWGDHPVWYDVQCRLCTVERLCAEETGRRNLDQGELPHCFGGNPLAKHKMCWDCRLYRLCLKETGECPGSEESETPSSETETEATDDEIGGDSDGEVEK